MNKFLECNCMRVQNDTVFGRFHNITSISLAWFPFSSIFSLKCSWRSSLALSRKSLDFLGSSPTRFIWISHQTWKMNEEDQDEDEANKDVLPETIDRRRIKVETEEAPKSALALLWLSSILYLLYFKWFLYFNWFLV